MCYLWTIKSSPFHPTINYCDLTCYSCRRWLLFLLPIWSLQIALKIDFQKLCRFLHKLPNFLGVFTLLVSPIQVYLSTAISTRTKRSVHTVVLVAWLPWLVGINSLKKAKMEASNPASFLFSSLTSGYLTPGLCHVAILSKAFECRAQD